MLVLSRKKNQQITFSIAGNEVVLMVVEIRGDKVRLGFDADESVIIKRAELTGPWKRGITDEKEIEVQ